MEQKTFEQIAAEKYPYLKAVDEQGIPFDRNKERRLAYAQALKDTPQLRLDVLEAVRDVVVNIFIKNTSKSVALNRVNMLNLSTFLPNGGDGLSDIRAQIEMLKAMYNAEIDSDDILSKKGVENNKIRIGIIDIILNQILPPAPKDLKK